jgi:hypothetical protein
MTPRACHCSPVECALIIRLIIQTILLYPSGAVWTDEVPIVSRLYPSGAIQADAKHPTRNWKVEDSSVALYEELGRELGWRCYLVRLAPQEAVMALLAGTKLSRISALALTSRVRTTTSESSCRVTVPECSCMAAWRA